MAGDQQVRAAAAAGADVSVSAKRGLRGASASVVSVTSTGSSVLLSSSSSPSAKSEHLSAALEAAIRLLPGNDRCADCKAIYPQWAAVSFGVLVCLACAGQHRSLGVGVSFVKSLGMDSWSPTEQRSLEVGGNAKWAAVCTATATTDLPLASKYRSSVAEAYRSRILLAATSAQAPATHTATEFLASLACSSTPTESFTVELPRSPPPAPSAALSVASVASSSAPTSTAVAADALSVKCTTCQCAVLLEQLDAHSKACVVSGSPSVSWRKYECDLGASGQTSLGISLTKTRGGFAEVTRVTPGGEAEALAVAVGSYVVGLNDVKTSAFEEIVALVRTLPRPIRFHFAVRRAGGGLRAVSDATIAAAPAVRAAQSVPPTISSVPEPISVDVEITFNEKELGCALQVRDVGCVVQHVDKGGPAHARGVLVGSRIVEVNGRRFLKPEDVIREIQTSRRPMRVKFHRVEGLMRGWSRR